MTDMIELVARAICRKTNIAMEGVSEVIYDNPDFVIPAHKRTDGKELTRWRLYIPQACAAMEAMRQYNFDMEQACMKAMKDGEPFELVWERAFNVALRQS